MIYAGTILISFLISFLTIPLLGKLAKRIDFVDRPTKRKTHSAPIPMMAGIGIFAAFFISYFIFKDSETQKDVIVFISSLLILGIGLVDDWYKTKSKEFHAFPRLAVYFICASMIYACGIRFSGFNAFWIDKYILFPKWLEFSSTILWIVGLTVVINWIDGLDGLAGGISVIATTTFFIVSLVKQQHNSALMSLALIGALIGYLRYNLPPAKIYMSDSGATFIGFMIAIISLDSAFKHATVLSMFIPVLALGVPIFDNLRVIFLRLSTGKKIYAADKLQIHHQLIGRGLDVKVANALLYLGTLCLNLISIILLIIQP